MLTPPANIDETLRAMAKAIGADAAYYDALLAAYQLGVLSGQIEAREAFAAQLDRTIFGAPLPHVPTFLKKQAH
jgi:hypothetical protein